MSALTLIMSSVVLSCAAPTSGKADDGSPLVAMLKIPVPAEAVESVRTMTPPLSKVRYEGEDHTANEWAFSQNNKNLPEMLELARVTVVQDLGSTFSFRYGAIRKTANKLYKFEELMRGTCSLKESENQTMEPSQ